MLKNFKLIEKILFVFVLFYLLFPQNAYAYIDPGTGSLITQAVISFLLGVAFSIRLFWKKLNAFFKRLFSRKPRNNENVE